MSRLILPKSESFINTYSKDASPISILLNHEETYGWLMNCFIQLTSYDNKYLDYYDFYYRNCPIIECQRIKKSFVYDSFGSYTRFVLDALKRGFYPMLLVNMKYIPEYCCEEDTSHDIFLYGFDEEEKYFYITDNFRNGKYSDGICSFTELEAAIEHVRFEDYIYGDFRECIDLMSYNPQYRAKFEKYRVKASIEDYLSSQPSKGWYVNHAMWDEEETRKRTFGLTCYDTITNHLAIAALKSQFIPGSNQAFHLMWEHKHTMLLRLNYMNRLENSIDESVFALYSQMLQLAEISLRLKIKYDIMPKEQILTNIAAHYDNIRDLEKEALIKILQIL